MRKIVSAVLNTTGLELVRPRTIHIDSRIGEPFSMEVHVKRDDNTIPNLTGATLRYRLYDQRGLKLYETTATGANSASQGVVTLSIDLPTSLNPKAYSWDVWCSIGDDRYQIIPTSVWRVTSVY